jgi:hypothetical protein
MIGSVTSAGKPPTREEHRRYLSYLERFRYFGRGGLRRLSLAEFLALEERLDRGGVAPEETREIQRLLLRD